MSEDMKILTENNKLFKYYTLISLYTYTASSLVSLSWVFKLSIIV